MKQPFAVKSKNFTLYEAFKKEAEKMGWKYNVFFNDFTEEKAIEQKRVFHFLDDKFFLTQTSLAENKFTLPEQWNEAISAAKEWFEEEKPKEAEQWQPLKDLEDIKAGMIIRNVFKPIDNTVSISQEFVVSNMYTGLVAVRTLPIENVNEWEVLK